MSTAVKIDLASQTLAGNSAALLAALNTAGIPVAADMALKADLVSGKVPSAQLPSYVDALIVTGTGTVTQNIPLAAFFNLHFTSLDAALATEGVAPTLPRTMNITVNGTVSTVTFDRQPDTSSSGSPPGYGPLQVWLAYAYPGDGMGSDTYADNPSQIAANFAAALASVSGLVPPTPSAAIVTLSTTATGALQSLSAASVFGGVPTGAATGTDGTGTPQATLIPPVAGKIPEMLALIVEAPGGAWTNDVQVGGWDGGTFTLLCTILAYMLPGGAPAFGLFGTVLDNAVVGSLPAGNSIIARTTTAGVPANEPTGTGCTLKLTAYYR